jgi:hypothetical protein
MRSESVRTIRLCVFIYTAVPPSLWSGYVIGTDRWRSEPHCVYPPAKAGHMAKRRVGVAYSPSMLELVRSGAVSPDRALCLPTFSHFVIVNRTSLSLSLSLSLPIAVRTGEGDSGGHVLRETTSRDLCGLSLNWISVVESDLTDPEC